MKKQTLLLAALLSSALAFAQVGVNTQTPQATLDVIGKPADASSLDGVIAPRMTGAELRAKTYTAAQTGALVYVTLADTAPAGQTINVTSTGYFYFDGTQWIKTGGGANVNIYNANGSLTSTRTLMLNGFQLNFTGALRSTYWDLDGRIHQRSNNASTDAVMGFHGGAANLWLQQWYNANAAISADGNSTGLSLATRYTNVSAPITLSTTPGGNTAEVERMRITGEGNIGMNTTDPTEKLDNNGVTRLRSLPLNGAANAIYTMSDGSASTAQDQTFTATRTLVADANGVIGYVSGLPGTGGGTPPTGAINVGETVSQIYSIPASTTNTNTFNLNTYVTANGLPALPVLDGLRIDLQGVSGTYYDPRIYNVSPNTQLISYQSFATQVNENKTSLNNSIATGAYVQADNNNIVYWTTSAAEVETTNLQVQIDANTYRWYEFKWWCMEFGTGATASKKIFLSITRKA